MELTGTPLIALTLVGTAAAIAGTTLLWRLTGRWRPVTRSVGVLLCEALLVLSAGLVANRQEEFYPSWQALTGDTGTAATTALPPAGSLDLSFGPGRLTVPWLPPGSPGWHLAAAAQVTVPADYPTVSGSFPALVSLGGRAAPAGLVRVSAEPTTKTTPVALAALPAQLATGLRVTGHGWALLASAPFASLAGRLIRDDPGRFTSLVLVGGPPAGFRCPPGVAVAVARPAMQHGALPPGATPLIGSWAAATRWAVERTPLPLAAPEVLPTAAVG